MNTQTPWAARITRAIAGEIRQRRTARGMSAEDLAAACADLGMPIPRSTLADLENGRRASISVAEWLAIAAALDVPPVMLLCPVGSADTAEVLPDTEAPAFRAAQWVAGEAPLRHPGHADVLTDWLPTIGPAAPGRARHQARPGRPVLVVPDLADLRGPDAGTVELPLWLYWSRPD